MQILFGQFHVSYFDEKNRTNTHICIKCQKKEKISEKIQGVISIVIKMFFHDNAKHHKEHIHVEYAGYEASFDFEGNQLSGNLPTKQSSAPT